MRPTTPPASPRPVRRAATSCASTGWLGQLLLATLTAYLDAGSSLTETAAVPGVHRNTAASRVAEAQELLGVELTDPDERLALHLACRSVPFHS